MNRICILATQRSGSTWVMDSIQASTGMPSILGELFLDRMAKSEDPWAEPWGNLVPPVRFWDWRTRSRLGKISAPGAYLSFIELFYRSQPIFGFKLMQDQLLRQPHLLFHLRRHNYSIIHLVRRNLLEVYVSRLRMGKGKPHARSSALGEAASDNKIMIDPRIAKRAMVRELWMRSIARKMVGYFGLPVQEVAYEKLVQKDSQELCKISSVVGQDVNLWHSDGLKKNTSSSIEERIENYDEVLRFFEKTSLDPTTYQSNRLG